MMKSTTLSRSGVSASGVTEMSTWLDASTGTLVSWLTGTACSFTPSRFAYSLASSHAGPLHASPCPVVFSTSHGAFASTPTRSTPAFLIASTRGLVPGAGTGTAAVAMMVHEASSSATRARPKMFDMNDPLRWKRCESVHGPAGAPRAAMIRERGLAVKPRERGAGVILRRRRSVVKFAAGVYRLDVARADHEVAEAFASAPLLCEAPQNRRELGEDFGFR